MVGHVSVSFAPLHLVVLKVLVDFLLSKQIGDLVPAVHVQMFQSLILLNQLLVSRPVGRGGGLSSFLMNAETLLFELILIFGLYSHITVVSRAILGLPSIIAEVLVRLVVGIVSDVFHFAVTPFLDGCNSLSIGVACSRL